MMTRKVGNTRFAYKLDKLFWFFVSFYPVITYSLYCICLRTELPVTFLQWFQTVIGASDTISSNVIYTVFSSLFGSTAGFFPFLGPGMLYFFTWFALVEVVHLCFDVVVFTFSFIVLAPLISIAY